METMTSEATVTAPFSAEQVVVLRVHGGEYAVPIGRVQEIVRVPAITSVPGAGFGVEGIINLRGRVLPVIDLAMRLGMDRSDRGQSARIVVIDWGEEGIGLLVDGVSEVLRIDGSTVAPTSAMVTGTDITAVRGVAKLGERLILLLDLEAALT